MRNFIFPSFKTLSPFEKLLYLVLTLFLFVSFYAFLYKLSFKYSSLAPSFGGQINEAIFVPARHINPVLANSDTDKAISRLVFSSLYKTNGKKGPDGIVTDIAEFVSISDDKKEYTIKIKKGVLFHDGKELTAEDILFTVNLIQDPQVQSPLRPQFEGVLASAIDKYTIKFSLPKPYAPFLGLLSFGILPKHLWQNIDKQNIAFSPLNEKAIGSGPYKIYSIEKDINGTINKVALSANKNYYGKKAKISKIIFTLYKDKKEYEEALKNKKVGAIFFDNFKIKDKEKYKDFNLYKIESSRVFALFMNSNNNELLAKQYVRQAIKCSIDIENISFDILVNTKLKEPFARRKTCENPKNIMSKNDWKLNADNLWEKDGKTIGFALAVLDDEVLAKLAENIKKDLRAKGFDIRIKKYKLSELSQKIILAKEFELLLFGEDTGRWTDLYPFWHSSQKEAPGLNISKYTNKKLDEIAEKLRLEEDPQKRLELLSKANEIFEEDVPAVFLYSPYYVYALDKNIKGFEIEFISKAYERFDVVSDWFALTDRVWNFLQK